MAERIDPQSGEIFAIDSAFDPGRHLSKVKGQDYLEVKYRIAWMRAEHPDADLHTDLVSHTDGRAIMRATVNLPEGGSATGWGSETTQSFENYIEKAETKAIGRALAALGYGTVGAMDGEDEPLADAPVNRSGSSGGGNYGGNGAGSPYMATAPQKSRIQRLAAEMQMQPEELNGFIQKHSGVDFANMNKRQASGIIDLLEARRPEGNAGPQEAQRTPQVSGTANGGSNASQARTTPPVARSAKPSNGAAINAGQVKAIMNLATKLGMPDHYLLTYASDVSGEKIETIEALSFDGAGAVIVALQNEKAE